MEGEELILATKDVVSVPLAREYENEVIKKPLNFLCSKKPSFARAPEGPASKC